MVERIRKILRRLDARRRQRLDAVILAISQDDLLGLDVKKLKGRDDAYRVRVGDYRVIFLKRPMRIPEIIAIEHRSESTYRDI